MHAAAFDWIRNQVSLHGPWTHVVEIGGKNINGTVRPLFGAAAYTAVDLVSGPGIDVVADGATYTPGVAPDCVICAETLEHANNAQAIVTNMRAIAASGARIIITCAAPERPSHSGVDGDQLRDGEYYGNIDPADLATWLAGLNDVLIVHVAALGDLYASAVKP